MKMNAQNLVYTLSIKPAGMCFGLTVYEYCGHKVYILMCIIRVE